jgi:hypothetical protein
MKLTKKTFTKGLRVKVIISQNNTIWNSPITKFEAFSVDNLQELDLYTNLDTLVIQPDVILITEALKVYEGSPRAIFKIEGSEQLYQSFWADFATFTRTVE